MIDVHFPDQLEPERFRGGRSQVNRAPGARDYLLPALWSGETQKRRKLAVKAFREASTSARIAYVTTERIEQATAVLKGETPE